MIRPPARRVVPSDRELISDEWCRDQLTETGEPIELRLSKRTTLPPIQDLELRLTSHFVARKRSPAAWAPDVLRWLCGCPSLRWIHRRVAPSRRRNTRSALGVGGLLAFENRRGLVIYRNIYSTKRTVTLSAAVSPIRSDGIHRSGWRSFGRSLLASFHRK